jgi:hypothetical protein
LTFESGDPRRHSFIRRSAQRNFAWRPFHPGPVQYITSWPGSHERQRAKRLSLIDGFARCSELTRGSSVRSKHRHHRRQTKIQSCPRMFLYLGNRSPSTIPRVLLPRLPQGGISGRTCPSKPGPWGRLPNQLGAIGRASDVIGMHGMTMVFRRVRHNLPHDVHNSCE